MVRSCAIGPRHVIAVPKQQSREPAKARLRSRLCHVSLTLESSGPERLLVDFARFHDRESFQVRFAAMGDVGPPADDIRQAGCEVTAMASVAKGRTARVRELARYFRQRHIDVVHTHNALPHLYATIAARLAGVSVVIHTRHGRRFGETVPERLQFAFASRLADCTVAVSDDTAGLCRHLGWLDQNRLTRVWNGIDVERFPWSGPVPQPRAISVARLSREKDLATLVEAVALIRPDIPDFRLQIVGDGPERANLQQLVHLRGLDGVVSLLGERSDIPGLLAGAALYVSSSMSEGISPTLLEAMATGLPVVATRVGGNPEVVLHERTGLLVPPESPGDLAVAIRDVCRRPDVWNPWGKAGRHRVEQHFSIRKMVQTYEQLYLDRLAVRSRAKRRTQLFSRRTLGINQ